MADDYGMDLAFSGEIWHWRGPAPFYFVTVPEDESLELRAMAPVISYGWGCIRVKACVGGTRWETSLIPKDGLYALPLKDMVRNAEGIGEGDTVTVRLVPGGPQ